MLLYPSPVPTLPPSFLKAPNPLQVSCESPDDSTTDAADFVTVSSASHAQKKEVPFSQSCSYDNISGISSAGNTGYNFVPNKGFHLIFFFFFSSSSVFHSPHRCVARGHQLIVSRLLIVIIRCNKHATSEARPEDVESQPDRLAVACGV